MGDDGHITVGSGRCFTSNRRNSVSLISRSFHGKRQISDPS
ncbi:hypothetical protein NJ7G_0567 [Natrinema sp. J7-2]|nr:hypothetical protein NJ7G_0567 [Natrinema sp. J7-2]